MAVLNRCLRQHPEPLLYQVLVGGLGHYRAQSIAWYINLQKILEPLYLAVHAPMIVDGKHCFIKQIKNCSFFFYLKAG